MTQHMEIRDLEAREPVANNEVAELAFTLWRERGCPFGSPGEDWFHAERLLLDTDSVEEPVLRRAE
ncbi:MAG: DUF2934 domain-containing protein [Bryobacteraceae bacterium]